MMARVLGTVAAVGLVLLVWIGGAAASPPPASTSSGVLAATPSPTPTLGTKDELERQKLQGEITKLAQENARYDSAVGWLLALAPFLTVVVGVLTLGATLKKQSGDLVRANEAAATAAQQWREEFHEQQKAEAEKARQWRETFDRQQQQDRESREKEVLRRFDETLTHISADLASDKLPLRLHGAASVGLFVKERYSDVHSDLLTLIIASLKSQPEHAVAGLLRGHLSRTLRLLCREGRDAAAEIGDRLDLTGLDLYRLSIPGLALPKDITIDLAFATLRDADLRDTRLFRARGGEAELGGAHFTRAFLDEARFNKAKAATAPAYFHASSLVSATFKEATLPRADLRQARLQGARFDRAILSGARFEGADLADAYFLGSTFDEGALLSIATGAKRWRQAHFDPSVAARLEQLSGSSAGSQGPG